MAKYSNQYSWKHFGEEGDFCIFKLARRIKPGYYINEICEGYGFVAICKEEDKEIKIAIPVGDINEVEWISLEELGIKPKKNIFKRLKKLLPKKYV